MSKNLPEVFVEIFEKYSVTNQDEFLGRLFSDELYDLNEYCDTDLHYREFEQQILLDYQYQNMNDGNTGGEGEDEHCSNVIKLHDKYYRASWSYYSYNGCEYDYIANTVQEVVPKEKVVTVFERP